VARPKKTPTVAVTFRIAEDDVKNLEKMAEEHGVPEMKPGTLARWFLTRVSSGAIEFPIQSVDAQDSSRK